MPTYEYECMACGHRFEKYQSMVDNPIKKCPKCGKAKARRMISGGAGVLFKGNGFYQTDYRSKGYKEAAKKDKPASASPSCAGDCSSCPGAKK
ncbi:MAG: zinc ribbon domain-containing protein [Candidatus Omnitrophica bacterium]|nr:zinc ribbon domain-containing protein [Candidatus Omnitrophota bacterium]